MFAGFLGAATWAQWGHGAIVMEAVGCILTGASFAFCAVGIFLVGYFAEVAAGPVALRIAAALTADPLLRDRVVRRLANAVADLGRTPDLRQTKPFETIRPIGVVR